MCDERVFRIFWFFSWSQRRLPQMSPTQSSSRKTCLHPLQVCLTPHVLPRFARFFFLLRTPACGSRLVVPASPWGPATRPATSGHFLGRLWITKTNIRIDGLVIGNRRPLEVDPPEA